MDMTPHLQNLIIITIFCKLVIKVISWIGGNAMISSVKPKNLLNEVIYNIKQKVHVYVRLELLPKGER